MKRIVWLRRHYLLLALIFLSAACREDSALAIDPDPWAACPPQSDCYSWREAEKEWHYRIRRQYARELVARQMLDLKGAKALPASDSTLLYLLPRPDEAHFDTVFFAFPAEKKQIYFRSWGRGKSTAWRPQKRRMETLRRLLTRKGTLIE